MSEVNQNSNVGVSEPVENPQSDNRTADRQGYSTYEEPVRQMPTYDGNTAEGTGDKNATMSMFFGIAALVFALIVPSLISSVAAACPLIAIISGIVGLVFSKKEKEEVGQRSAKGKVGLVTSIIAIVLGALSVLLAIAALVLAGSLLGGLASAAILA